MSAAASSTSTSTTTPPTQIIQPEEYDYFVQCLRKFRLIDIGNQQWIEMHEILLKLNQQAYLDVQRKNQEEMVKELLVTHGKLPCLIHEIYTILIWRCKILPKLFIIDKNPNTTFMLYTILFHEATAVSLIEIVLFHQNGCESLFESALDLIDYSIQSITQLIGLITIRNMDGENVENNDKNLTTTEQKEFQQKQNDLLFKIGLRCLSILSYLVDKLDVLPLGAINRLIETHDVPCVLSEILHLQPWRRYNEKKGYVEKLFDTDHWTPVWGDAKLKLTKIEAQTWICLRQLLFNSNVIKSYTINEFRQRELAKCQGLMNDQILDQLPPLAELKHYLCTLQLTKTNMNKGNNCGMLMVEELPQIREEILQDCKLIGWKKIVQAHADLFLHKSTEDIILMAKQLNGAYNTDLWEQMEQNQHDNENVSTETNEQCCGLCGKVAEKKCFQCRKIYYCCRECQVKDWPTHKLNCNK